MGEKRAWRLLHPALNEVAEEFEEEARELAWMTDRVLRRYARKVVDQQPALRRLADVMVDLFVLAAVMSRVNAALEARGEEGAARELEIVRVFMHRARARIRANLSQVDANEDERVRTLAQDALQREGYGWDLI